MTELILHISGRADVLSSRSRALRKVGYRVVEAASELKALRLARDTRPNLIVVTKTRELSANFCIRLKTDPITADTPVVAICSPGAQKEWMRFADLCLPERITSGLFISVIRLLLRTRVAELGLAQAEANSK